MATEALALRDVEALYGDSRILHSVSFSLHEGHLLGLLGRNGAGKSTCMNVIVGLTPARRGRVVLFGRDVTGLPPEKVGENHMAFVPQGRRVFKSLSVRENLEVALRHNPEDKRSSWTLDRVFHDFPRLRERQAQYAGTLSGGEQQMLAIARALMANPRVLLMDEPSEGLAPQIIAEVISVIRRLKESGLSIVLVEQNINLAFDLADDIVVLNSGRVVMTGPSEVVRTALDFKQHLGVY